MEFTSTVLYKQQLAYYNVLTRDGKTFIARLLNGKLFSLQPPHEVVLEWDGNQCKGIADDDVLYFLRFDIQKRFGLQSSSTYLASV